MRKRVKKKKIIQALNKFLVERFHCLIWAAAGIYTLYTDRLIGRWQYFVTWALLIVVMWCYMPNKQHSHTVTGIAAVAKKYPIGSKVRLFSDLPDYKPRIVQGYEQIGEFYYIIFSDGHKACVERVAEKEKYPERNGYKNVR